MHNSDSQIFQISAGEAYKALQADKNIVLIDVRTPEEYSRGKIEDSINVPLSDLNTEIQSLVPDKESLVYLYCLSGARSDMAAAMMQEMGYTNVFSLTSGLLAWRSGQYPLI